MKEGDHIGQEIYVLHDKTFKIERKYQVSISRRFVAAWWSLDGCYRLSLKGKLKAN
jgi:hypothetical protein